MKSEASVVQALNQVLTDELTLINQTFLHARMLQNWGLDKLGGAVYGHSITAMKEGDRLIKRILLLEGLPNLQELKRLGVGERPAECLASDHRLHASLRQVIVAAIATCEQAVDYQSRDHLEALLHQTEETIDWHETQADLIEALGIERYLQSQIDEED